MNPCLSSSISIHFPPSVKKCLSLSTKTTRRSSRISSICSKRPQARLQENLVHRQVPRTPRRREELDDSGVEHHHRVLAAALSGKDAIRTRGRGARAANAFSRPIFRPARECPHAEDRYRSAAAGGQKRS